MAAGGRGRAESRARHRAGPPPRRPVRVLVPLAIALVLAVAGAEALLPGRSAGPAGAGAAPVVRTSVAAGSTPAVGGATTAATTTAGARMHALQVLLDRRARALVHRDRAGWLASVGADDAGTTGYAARQGAVFDRLSAVPLASWRYDVAGPGPPLPAPRRAALPRGSWVAEVVLEWAVTGAGGGAVRRQQSLTVVPAGRGWALAGDADGTTVPDLWDLGPVSVLRSSRSLLLGTAAPAVLAACAPLADAAAARVDAVWGTDWPRSTVLEVPATQGQLAQLLGRADSAGLEQVAAVTTGELVGRAGATRGDHVVLNPGGFSLLAPLGQRVVLTHELTHVATRASAERAVPVWLSEGFADWVAYSGTGLSRRLVAADLIERVRAQGPPADLPGAQDFDPARTSVAAAYGGAWLALELLARRAGPDRLVALYRAVSSGPPAPGPAGTGPAATGPGEAPDPDRAADAALRSVLGTDRADLVRDWRASLVLLARPGTS